MPKLSHQGREDGFAVLPVLLSPFSEATQQNTCRSHGWAQCWEEFRARNLLTSTQARHSSQILTGAALQCWAGTRGAIVRPEPLLRASWDGAGHGRNIKGKEDQKGVV